jgi:hypothetical protein
MFSARELLSPESLVVDQLRARWLADIGERGPLAARADAVDAFTQRMGCSRPEAEALVERAWSMLHLSTAAL